MDYPEKTPQGAKSETIAKGAVFTLFPLPKGGEKVLEQLRRLKEDGQSIGILRATADSEKPKAVARLPKESWAVIAEAEIDLGSLPEEGSLALPGQSFKTLLAIKPNGQHYVCFANEIIPPNPGEGKRNLAYTQWFPIDLLENIKEARQRVAGRTGSPLTLKTEELNQTTFQFF